MLTVSGSKSQPGSGVPAAAFANKSDNFVSAPSATFRQKSGPSAALKVTGSHSSKATTCAELGGSPCSSAAGRKLKVRAAAKIVRVLILFSFLLVQEFAREAPTACDVEGRSCVPSAKQGQPSPLIAKASILAAPICSQSFLHRQPNEKLVLRGTCQQVSAGQEL